MFEILGEKANEFEAMISFKAANPDVKATKELV